MEDKKDYQFFLLRLIIDIVTICFSWFAAYFIRFKLLEGGQKELFTFFAQMTILVLVLYVFFMNRNRLYNSMRNLKWIDEMQMIVYSSLQASILLIMIIYFFFPERVSRLTLFIFACLVTVILVLERIVIKNALIKLRSKGRNLKSILLIGYGKNLEIYAKSVLANSGTGLRILGQFDGDNKPIKGIMQIRGELQNILSQYKPRIVVIGYPQAEYEKSRLQLACCYDILSNVLVIPDLPYSMIGTRIAEYDGIPLMQINHVNISFFDRMLKRVFDFIIASTGIIMISPLLLIISLLVAITSKGPVFFVQKRVTENGKIFPMLKFRTMKHTPESNQLKWTVKHDDRCTKLGKFLRSTSLDELPQLFNVLIGQMSLIGPRPERPEFVDKFINEIPGYQLRHKVKAGMSGWSQINGLRGNCSLEKRIESDLYYIRNWSILLDLKILYLTFIKGFINKNAY